MKKKSQDRTGSPKPDINGAYAPAALDPQRAGTEAAGPATDKSACEDGGAADVPGQPPVIVDPQFEDWIQPLSPAEYQMLQESLLREGGPREPLILWRGHGILLDGHHRYRICRKHALPYAVREIELADREAALRWIEENQLAKRNITPEGEAFCRGRRYLLEKYPHGGHRPKRDASAQEEHLKTDERIAQMFKVSATTIRRDAEFTLAVGRLADVCGLAILCAILTRQVRVSRPALLHMSKLGPGAMRKAVGALLQPAKADGRLGRGQKKDAPSPRYHLPKDMAELARLLRRELTAEKLERLRKAMNWQPRSKAEYEPGMFASFLDDC